MTNKKNGIVDQKINLIAEAVFEKKQQGKTLGLYMGEYGILLFVFYYLKYSKNKTHILLVDKYVETLINRLSEEMRLYTFCDGLTGVLYLFDFMRDNDFLRVDISRIQPILDKYITTLMRYDIQRNYYDFMHGALGAGFYFLKREDAIEYIYELIDFLYNTAIKDKKSCYFKWGTRIINEKKSVYNLALSHGISSIIVFLSRVLEKGITDGRVVDMLIGSVDYILSQQFDSLHYDYFFPDFVYNDGLKNNKRSRLAWCYGDLGIGMAIWQSGKILKNEEYKKAGLRILMESTKRRNLKEEGVLDAGLCHGSSGISMIFRRMYIETQQREFADAWDYWIEKTLNFSIFNDGLAGYKTYVLNGWECDYSLLTGISGIGLALISYIAQDEQNWDELFLLS